MPRITLNKKVKREKRKYQNKKNNLNHAVYNTEIWRKLRLKYLSENPLCERCLKAEILTPAAEVHHKTEIDKGKDIMEKKSLGYDWNNLEALCEHCHSEHHINKQ